MTEIVEQAKTVDDDREDLRSEDHDEQSADEVAELILPLTWITTAGLNGMQFSEFMDPSQ